MTKPAFDVIARLRGRTLATAESITGGGIGAALTAVPGSSAVYLGGVISYDSRVKRDLLGVSRKDLETLGAVSAPVAVQMALGARKVIGAEIALSVTGLAGPGGDAFGHAVGTVFIGYADGITAFAREYHFCGSREAVREQTVEAALRLVLEQMDVREGKA